MSKWTKDANLAWNLLRGVFVIYKPPGVHYESVKRTLLQNLCRDLNEMEVRPQNKYVVIEGETNKKMNVVVRDSYADHILVVGPRYSTDNFKLTVANKLAEESSGVLVCGVNSGTSLIAKLKQSKLTKFYKLKGILGQTRTNNFVTGKIIAKSTWKKVKRHNIDHICASMQASHQKKMFELCGLDMQSQAAYDLAVQGPIRPIDSKVPMVYSIKCINYEPPEFELEIVCLNENEEYLKTLVAELGIKLHSSAYCSYIQCAQFGLFNAVDALLSKHWNLQYILNNINHCHKLLKENPCMLKQENHNLVHQTMEQ